MGYDYAVPRTKGLYDPASQQPFALSRSKIDEFERCPRCFYLDRRLGIGPPPGYAFTLNNRVDALLKVEFDYYREKQQTHPAMSQGGLNGWPAKHPQLDDWRSNFKGVRYLHEQTQLEVFGAIDDLWIDREGNYSVVDYKATGRTKVVESIDDMSHAEGYMRQLDVYQWLLLRHDLPMTTAYWLYVTGGATQQWMGDRLKFETRLIPYQPTTAWVEITLRRIKFTLDQPEPPVPSDDCNYCRYAAARQQVPGDC